MRNQKRWTPREVEYLRTHHGKPGVTRQTMATALGRTAESVYSKVSRIGLAGSPPLWTAREDAVLARVDLRASQKAGLLPGRTRLAVLGRAFRLRAKTGYPAREQPATRGPAARPSLPHLRCLEDAHA